MAKEVACDWQLATREDRKEICHSDRVGAGAGTGALSRTDRQNCKMVIGAVADDEGGEPGFSRRSRLTIAGGVRRDNWSK